MVSWRFKAAAICWFSKNSRSPWNGVTRDSCGTACRDGLLYVNYDLTPALMRLFFIPFDPRQKSARFNLQWPADSRWLPWAIAATPDASTVAVIAQETDSDDTATARFGRIRALIYHPGGLRAAASAWPISSAFEIDAPTIPGWSSRFVALDPDAHALLYWSSAAATVMRYDPRDGKAIGSLELGQVTARSRDGRRVAGVSPQAGYAFMIWPLETRFLTLPINLLWECAFPPTAPSSWLPKPTI